MKKILKAASVGMGICVLAAGLAGCNNKIEYKYVPDPVPYVWSKKEIPIAATDKDMTIDGKFDEARWKNVKWFTGKDIPTEVEWFANQPVGYENPPMTADISVTTSYGRNGMYVGMKVREQGGIIYVNPERGTSCNSSMELHMAPIGDPDSSLREFENVFAPGISHYGLFNGEYYSYAYTMHEIMPYAAFTKIGGEFNTEECEGYNIEAFLPWGYFEWAGYDISDTDSFILGINPVHIFSRAYEGMNNTTSRLWSSWCGRELGVAWRAPATFIPFGKDGVEAYNYTIEVTGEGAVEAKAGINCLPVGKTVRFEVNAEEGHELASLTVDGSAVMPNNGTFEISKPTKDVEIKAEFRAVS